MNIRNERLSLVSLSSLVYCLWVMSEPKPSEAYFSYFTLGQAPALPKYIRLGWKGLPGTNVLTYYEHSQIMDKKLYNIGACFNVCGQGQEPTLETLEWSTKGASLR